MKDNQINSNTPPALRQSNIELLRIVAMMMVLMEHADSLTYHLPNTAEMAASPIAGTLRYWLLALCIGAVDVFVLISGWFGIRASWRGLTRFLFQVVFFYVTIYAILVLVGYTTFSLRGMLFATGIVNVGWFVPAYIGLYILSPVLNLFVDHATREQHRNVLIGWYVFQTLFANIGYAGCTQFVGGYSTISFIGLYLLAQYVRRYPLRITARSQWFDLSVYLLCSLVMTAVTAGPMYLGVTIPMFTPWMYINPVIICGASFLLLAFSKMQFRSRLVNWVASSAFAVYLLHTMDCTWPLFHSGVRWAASLASGYWAVGSIALFLLGVFIVAVLYDQVRKWCFSLLKCSQRNRF